MIVSKVGESFQEYRNDCPESYIIMDNPRPDDGEWLAQEDGTWIENLYKTEHEYVCEKLIWCDLQEKLIQQGSSRAIEGLTLESLYSFAEALRNYTTHDKKVIGERPVIESYIA